MFTWHLQRNLKDDDEKKIYRKQLSVNQIVHLIHPSKLSISLPYMATFAAHFISAVD